MAKDVIRLIVLILCLALVVTLLYNIVKKDKELELTGQVSKSQKVRSKFDQFSELGNPEKYDKDRSILRYAPVVFLVGGAYFVIKDWIRELKGIPYEEEYRPFWKEEPFGGFHPEFEDEMGRVYGSDRTDGRGLLGYKTYGKDAEEKQAEVQERQDAMEQGYNPYQEQPNQQQEPQDPNQYQQVPNQIQDNNQYQDPNQMQ